MRSLWQDEQQSSALVCDSVRRHRAHCAAMELRVRERRRRPALLWRSSRPDIYQPLVRVSLYAVEAGFHPSHISQVASHVRSTWMWISGLRWFSLYPIT